MTELDQKEKRFLREWEIQRKGSTVLFFILYSVVWTIIFWGLAFVLGLLLSLIDANWVMDIVNLLLTFLIGFLFTLVMYYRNQYRYLRIRLKQDNHQK